VGSPYFISFEKKRGGFVGYLSMESLSNAEIDHNRVIMDAVKVYSVFIRYAKRKINGLQREKKQKGFILARSMWKLGDKIFQLVDDLKAMGLEIDDLYAHLTRDLNKNKTWLSRVIAFRSHVQYQRDVQKDARWSRFVESPRKQIELMRKTAGSEKGRSEY